MAFVAAERAAAVREVTEVYELIKLQQPLLLLLHPPSNSQQLAQILLGKALRALNVALSVMKQQQQQPASAAPVTPISTVKSEPHHLISPPSPASADSQAMPIIPNTATSSRGAKRRRRSLAMETGKRKRASSSSSSWAYTTAMPYDDGYEWRKYGEKKINGTLFTRSYFRCTYKDDACCCPATKHVQQMDNSSNNNSDSPMFHVTYNNDHTCSNNSSAKASVAANTGSSNLAASLLTAAGCCNNDMKQESTAHAATAAAMNMMKQEEPVPLLLLPALVELEPVSACFPYEQIMSQCQEPLLFPVSMEQQQQQLCGAFRDDDGEIPSATGSSCISGETSWDGYPADGDMAAQMMAATSAGDDDLLHDLDPFLLWDNSFMDC